MATPRKKLTFYSPSQFYPNPYYFGGGYGPDGVFYAGYNATADGTAGESEIIADTVVIKNLPFSLTDEMLMAEIVKVVGACVHSVTRVTDKKGRFKGTAFAKFLTVEDAESAMVKMNDVVIMGRPVKLEMMRADGLKAKKKRKKKKKTTPAKPPVHVRTPAKPSTTTTTTTTTTTELVPAETFEAKGRGRGAHRRSRGNSDMDMNWRSKTTTDMPDMPSDPVSRAACQKLLEFKKSKSSKAVMITVRAAEQLKQVRRLAKALNLNHRIEEVTGTSWTVKFTRKSFFENPGRGSKDNRRFRSWSNEGSPPLSRGPRGVKKSDTDSGFRHRARTFSRDRTFTMRDRSVSTGSRKDRSESLVLYARGPDGTHGFKAGGGRGARKA